MTLFQSWADSLTLLKPKNLQLFVMVTIKSILEAYKLYFKYFWWLLLALLIFLFIAPDLAVAWKNNDGQNLARYATLFGMAISLYGILFLAACFVTRPSILQKDCAYFRTQFKKIILYWLAWWCLSVVLIKYGSFWKIFAYSDNVYSCSTALIFFVLFFADSDGGLKNIFISAWNAWKMVIYNLPLLLIVALCFGIPILLFNHLIYISPLMKVIIAAFLMPITVCTNTNIYIKRLHDQFDLYFKQPQ
jgi:hypothetical protein